MRKEPSIYATLGPDEMNELQSRFLISGWSYSKVASFARNEKAFEMSYIYGIHGKSSATTVAGSAYHEALKYFFDRLKEDGEQPDLVTLEQVVFDYIEKTPANYWKMQKTAPTVEDCITKSAKTSVQLVHNFLKEDGVYLDDIEEILEVEVYCSEFLTINGVDIPLPCNGKIDLVVRTKSGKVAVIDHKSKASFTPEDELALSIGVQAITYVNLYEQRTGATVDEVWFVENKYSANKDKSSQLNAYKVQVDDNTRKLYESLLYEPVKRLVQAVSDPDYVYIINNSDTLVDKAELYEFWCRTMISEIDDFNVEESKRELVAKRLKKVKDSSQTFITPTIIKNFKQYASQFISYDLSTKDMTLQQKIEHVLRSFGIVVNVAHSFEGYSSTTFLLEFSAGVKISSIFSKRLDIANALDVSNVRIANELAVYEGKSYVALDFVKKSNEVLLYDEKFIEGNKIPLGKDNYDKVIYWDLDNQSTPHALVCGATGSGKSVLVKNIIEAGLFIKYDSIIILDPKFEFVHHYGNIKGVEVYNDIEDIEAAAALQVEYVNKLVKEGKKARTLIVFDEFADAFANSRKGKELDVLHSVHDGNYANGNPKFKTKITGKEASLEDNLRIILQKGRSSGFRVVAATQRASAKIITGDAKVNFPVQICFRVPKETDSRVVLDEAGAESLAGKGDGLIKSPEYPDTVRFQAFFKP